MRKRERERERESERASEKERDGWREGGREGGREGDSHSFPVLPIEPKQVFQASVPRQLLPW